MGGPFEELADLDRLVHEPARLAILTALSACESADFIFLQRLIGITKGNLSNHLSRLEEAGLIRIDKAFVGKTPRTQARLTRQGERAIAGHWTRLERLREAARAWTPSHPKAGARTSRLRPAPGEG